MNWIKRVLLISVFYFSAISQSLAGNTVIPSEGDNADLAKKFKDGSFELTDIPIYIKYLTEKLVWVAGVAAVIFVMIGGYRYITGMYTGNEDGSEGKQTIKNVIIGLAFVAFSWMIIDLVVRFITE